MEIRWRLTKEGQFELWQDMNPVLCAHAEAVHADGRKIDTRFAVLKKEEMTENGSGLVLTYEAENGLCLEETLEVSEGIPTAFCSLFEENQNEVESRLLAPLVAGEPQGRAPEVWKSIWSKLLLVPYDNTMWLRYEAAPLRAGRKSYDLTVMFKEDTREGLLIGALDFDNWKNAVICSATDAKTLNAVCGVADEGTHDSLPMVALWGKRWFPPGFARFTGRITERFWKPMGTGSGQRESPLSGRRGFPSALTAGRGWLFG